MIRLRAFWESIRSTYWAVPSVMTLGAAALAIAIVDLDGRVSPDVVRRLSWVYAGGAEGAREVLSTIASSMITVAGVTFSITIVALTLASQQFGPRLLRNFMRDLGNQITLGTFVSTFLYCLLVLRTVSGTDEGSFVPHLAVTTGVLLATASLGVLIFFIHHVAASIQAAQIIAGVSGDLTQAIDRAFPRKLGQGESPESEAVISLPPDTQAGVAESPAAGYVEAIDAAAIMHAAIDHDVLIAVDAAPGRFVRPGSVLARYWPDRPVEGIGAAVAAAFIIGSERTATQDVGFFVDQLVDVALRALSPGINDPSTASICIDRLRQALCQLAERDPPSPYRRDELGVLRAVAHPLRFPDLADAAFGRIRTYARTSQSVSVRMMAALGDVALCARREADRAAVRHHLDLVYRDAAEAAANDYDRQELARWYERGLTALGSADLGSSRGNGG